MNSESVELIYLDPPFNSKRHYSAPIGSKAAGAKFKDAWTLDDIDEAWHGEIAEREPALYAAISAAGITHGAGMKSYLIMMAVRLLEMKRILTPFGSIFLHCDPTANSYLRMLLDAVFGPSHMRNEIVWCYTGPGSPKMRQFSRKHDTIFWYCRGNEWTFNGDSVRVDHVDGGPHAGGFSGGSRSSDDPQYSKKGKIPETWWAQARGNGLAVAARQSKQYLGYPTQKPLALLERIIRASSNPGDMVLDPFCGCATALVVAETLGRRWAGIDLSPLAVRLVGQRLREQHGLFGQITARTDIPTRTDLGNLPNYRTHKHTLYGRQEGICNGCLVHFPFRNLTVDHIVARNKGGGDNIDNLQLLCGACNSRKGVGSMAGLIANLLSAGIRNDDTYRSTNR